MGTDAELRGRLLQRFYDLQHSTVLVQSSHLSEIVPEKRMLANLCRQLSEERLIEWHAMIDFSGAGRITSAGSKSVENVVRSDFLQMVHHTVVNNSSNVVVGGGTVNNITIDIDRLSAAIDSSGVSFEEKAEAKSLLKKLIGNPLIGSILKKWFPAAFG